MILDDFELHAKPLISKAYCKECDEALHEVPNGFLSIVLYCSNCEAVYQIKLVKAPAKKINKSFLEQCHKAVKR